MEGERLDKQFQKQGGLRGVNSGVFKVSASLSKYIATDSNIGELILKVLQSQRPLWYEGLLPFYR